MKLGPETLKTEGSTSLLDHVDLMLACIHIDRLASPIFIMEAIQGISTQVKRFACDRCHSQKLRCPRPADGNDLTESCLRCQKAGASCNVSATLKTGRPSKALRLQSRINSRFRRASPSPQLSGHGAANSPLPTAISGSRSENRENEIEELFPVMIPICPTLASPIAPPVSNTPTLTLPEASSTEMVIEEFPELLDLYMDFSDTIDMSTIEEPAGHECRYTCLRFYSGYRDLTDCVQGVSTHNQMYRVQNKLYQVILNVHKRTFPNQASALLTKLSTIRLHIKTRLN